MCTRGIFQLKKLSLKFCDQGGSSKGVREFLKSDLLKEFVQNNPQIEFNFFLHRGNHPLISATYINGFVKDLTLRNKDTEEVLEDFFRVRNSFGRMALSHSGEKVYGTLKSVQGGWKPNLWNNYPVNELEKLRIIPPKPGPLIVSEKKEKDYRAYHKNYIFKVFRDKQIDKAN